MPEDLSGPPYLIFRNPSGDMTRMALEKLPITLGRRSTNEVQVLDPTVSRDHAHILRDNTEFIVEDLGSTHGTFVNEKRIDRHALGPNDRIRLGGATNHLLTFRSGSAFTMMAGTIGKTTTRHGRNVIKEQQDSTRNLEALLEISKALNSSLRLNDVLEKVMDAVIDLTEGERCMMLLGNDVDTLEVAAQRNLTSNALPTQYSQSVVSAVFGNGQAQILTDVAEDEHFSAQQSIVGLQLRTVMCVPLRLSHFSRIGDSNLGDPQNSEGVDSSARILGVLYVDRRSPTRNFGGQDLSMIESFASHAAIAIDNARLYEEALEKRRMEDELRVANRIQRSLLLSDFPKSDWYDVYALNIPSRGVGGDYYEFFETQWGELGFAVGDVSGKGIPAAMLMAALQAAFLAATQTSEDLAFVCGHVNNFLVERTSPERYATFFVGLLRPDGQMQFVNAGHNPALLVHGDAEPKRLMGGGMPLGLFADRKYEVQAVQLEVDDVVVVFSDGVTEANNPDEKEYGEEALASVVMAECNQDANGIGKAVFDAISVFSTDAPQHDDLTLMIIKHTAS